jgi:hypothetical protein
MTIQKRSFLSGLLYVSLAVIGPFAFLIIPGKFVLDATINAYAMDNIALLVIWLLLDIVIIVIEVVLAFYLWKLFNEHDERLSLIAFILRVIMIVIMVAGAIFLLLLIIDGGSTANTYIELHNKGVFLWQLFFSGHVFLLGFMLIKYLKTVWKYLGFALILGSFGYFIDSINNLLTLESALLTSISTILLIFVTLGEIGMAVALLMKKVVPSTK